MSDIFLSYATEDREHARTIAQALASRGWSVWWDREIPFGESFDRVIERELAAAKTVIVLWSRASVESDWVRNEARQGLRRGALLPAQLEPVALPLEFSNVQTADLSDWRPDQEHAAFDKLVQRLRAVLGAPTAPPPIERTAAAAAPDEITQRPDAERPRDGSRASPKRKAIAWVAAVLTLIGVIGAGYMLWSEVEVPSLIGLPVEQAVSVVASKGLVHGQTTARETAASPPGTVVDQSPSAAESAGRGSKVDLTVAAVPMVEVPRLLGKQSGEAEKLIAAARLELGVGAMAESAGAEPGSVIGQEPQAGARVAVGNKVTLTIATTPTVLMPELARLTLDRARETLQAAGLTLGQVSQQQTLAAPPGTVIEQAAKAGSRVGRGSAIDLVVASVDVVEVPKLVGLPLGKAKALLQREGLKLGSTEVAGLFADGDDSEPKVRSQTPMSGMPVARGTVVQLVVAQPGARVPILVKNTLNEAKAAMDRAGLTLGTIREVTIASSEPGIVVDQSPPPDRVVARGVRVDLTVTGKSAQVTLPKLVGTYYKSAYSTLRALGLRNIELIEGKSPANDPTVRPGAVLEVFPRSGQSVALDTPIRLTYAPSAKPGATFARMPAVVGLHMDRANEILRASGLTNFRILDRFTKDAPTWQVLSQSPKADAPVSPETRIEIVVAKQEGALPIKPPPRSKDEAAKVCPLVCAEQKMTWKAWYAEKPMYCYCTL